MSDYSSSQSRRRSSASSKPTESTRTTPYSGHFEQKLIDTGIYPDEYEHPGDRPAPEPANMSDIQAAQRVLRPSLSPSRFTEEDFKAFKQANARAKGETKGIYNVLPFIAGSEVGHRSEMDLPLSNLKPFDENLSDPKPDVYHGAALSAIHPRVRADLGSYIIPSTADLTRPAAPNFFVEGKSAQGRTDVAKRQAMHDGAMGARAMHELRNYKAEEPQYDNKARSFSATYQDGHLQTYAHHFTAPLFPGGKPECHMTQTKAFAMGGDRETFVKGATAYRNDRDRAKTERDSAIAHANQVARQMPAPSPITSLTTSRTSRSATVIANSDTSEDELARDEVTPVKRPRPSAASPTSHGSGHGPHARTASEAPMVISRASLTASKNSPSTTRPGRQPSVEERMSRQPSANTQNGAKNTSAERSRPMEEVSSKRMRHDDQSGWCFKHQGKSIFVADAQWTYREQDGRPALYYTRLNVFTYLSAANKR